MIHFTHGDIFAQPTQAIVNLVNHLASGGRVGNLSVATDESYIDNRRPRRIRLAASSVSSWRAILIRIFSSLSPTCGWPVCAPIEVPPTARG